jgi:hypothetical protein
MLSILAGSSTAHAGLYYSGEQLAELPSQWRGFLLDQRLLRNVAIKPMPKQPPSPLRKEYEQAAAELRRHGQTRQLTADELADRGALEIRLGEVSLALETLRAAQRQFPLHFRIAANLGTAWQLHGDLAQAADCLQQAVRLAPGKLQKAEELQLILVRQRQRPGHDSQALDDLFGIRYVGDSGAYEPGRLAAAERKKLPSDAVALVQQLALWLPADGVLLWQLAELANAHGDPKTAAAIMDGCVTEFGLHAAELRQHRRLVRAAAETVAQTSASPADGIKLAHQQHAGGVRTRSKRPLLRKIVMGHLPAVRVAGVNALPWDVLAETQVDRRLQPTFSPYLEELDGKEVSLNGFMQPLTEGREANRFLLIEYPVGCWYCEMPELAGIVLVELPPDRTFRLTRGLVKITGHLTLNRGDPERFLYTIGKAKVSEAD